MPNKPKLPQKQATSGRDLFQTPRYAVDLLLPFIPDSVHFIWECACGEGKISRFLEELFYTVFSTDIRETEWTEDGDRNFLDETPYSYSKHFGIDSAIITNPPYSLKRKFYEKCIELNSPFALLLPYEYSTWLIESKTRYGCCMIVPTRRIDYITPTGLSGANGHTARFHSGWLTRYFKTPHGATEVFVDLSLKDKENI